MDSISSISPVMSIISEIAGYHRNSLNLAITRIILDTQKSTGQQIVKMMETLGNTIDTYA